MTLHFIAEAPAQDDAKVSVTHGNAEREMDENAMNSDNSMQDSDRTGSGVLTSSSASQMAAMFGGRQPSSEMADVLDMLQSLHGKPIAELEAKEARKQPTPADAVKKLLETRGESTDPEAVGDVDNRSIDGPDGGIDIRVYKPNAADDNDALPVVLYVHGGGWVIADLDTYDSSARALCNSASCIVVSTHYRQGPEDRFPAAHEDVFAAYRWVIDNASDLGGNPQRIAVVGESAGGNMAAVVCMNARDAGVQLPLHQVLVYPVSGYDFSTPSYQEMTQAKPLNTPMMRWFFDNYLRNPSDGETPAISLDRADLSGLPPATIISAELDPLRSEGEMLAQQFKSAGVKCDQRTFDGVTHEFFGMGAVLPKAREAVAFAAEGLKRAFATA